MVQRNSLTSMMLMPFIKLIHFFKPPKPPFPVDHDGRFFKIGKLHREGEPATILPDDTKRWYENYKV